MFATRSVARVIGVSASGSPLLGRKKIIPTKERATIDTSRSFMNGPLKDTKIYAVDAYQKTFHRLSSSMTERDYDAAFNQPRSIKTQVAQVERKKIRPLATLQFKAKCIVASVQFCAGSKKPQEPRPEPEENESRMSFEYRRRLGKWGERELESILEQEKLDGIIKDYDTQLVKTKGTTTRIPDAVVTFWNDAELILDSKAFGSQHAAKPRQEVVDSFKEFRIDDLAERDYPSFVPGSFGFTILFVPLDSDLKLAFDANCTDDKGLHAYAWKRGILIATPRTLPLILERFSTIDPMDEAAIEEAVQHIFAITDASRKRILLHPPAELIPVKTKPTVAAV